MPENNPIEAGRSTGEVLPVRYDASMLTDEDVYLFNEGSHYRLYQKLGAHLKNVNGQEGVCFAVWAPNAESVSVIGDFNGWDKGSHSLRPRGESGIWEGFIPGFGRGDLYKYHVASRFNGYRADKTD
ncbi:MAG: 1,4-alpha-glucan branching enzyme, partial [Terriglobia bacterium]